MSRLPTPDELGEMLKAGKITREEAIEIMDRRAREEALKGMPGLQAGADGGPLGTIGSASASAEDAGGAKGSARPPPAYSAEAASAAKAGRLRRAPSEASAKESAAEGAAGPRAERRNDLIVEQWQAPGGGSGSRSLRGDGREFWEYEKDSLGPSRELIFTIVLIVGAILGLIALLVYGIMYLHRTFSLSP